jgi:hypothetical protein
MQCGEPLLDQRLPTGGQRGHIGINAAVVTVVAQQNAQAIP